MKLKFGLSIGFANANHEEFYEIDDEEFEGLDKTEKDQIIEEHLKNWAFNYIDWWYEEVDE